MFIQVKQINPNDWESASKEFVKDNLAKNLGDPKEVGRLVAFLLSGELPFINGAVIPIDGAQSAKC